MNVLTTKSIQLYPINMPFELYIKWKTKRSAEGNGWWFTASGRGRIGCDHVSWTEIGGLDDKQDKAVCKMMVDSKSDFLTDGTNVYTRMSPGLVKVTDTAFFSRMLQHWKAGSNTNIFSDVWEAKDCYNEDIENFKPIK